MLDFEFIQFLKNTLAFAIGYAGGLGSALALMFFMGAFNDSDRY